MQNQKVKNLINRVKRLAKEVYGELGSGFDEAVYQKAMEVGLRMAKIRYEAQKVVELKFKDHYVGEGFPDLIVHGDGAEVVVELKSIGSKIGGKEETQLQSYMKLLKIHHGLLINFQSPSSDLTKPTQLETREIKI